MIVLIQHRRERKQVERRGAEVTVTDSAGKKHVVGIVITPSFQVVGICFREEDGAWFRVKIHEAVRSIFEKRVPDSDALTPIDDRQLLPRLFWGYGELLYMRAPSVVTTAFLVKTKAIAIKAKRRAHRILATPFIPPMHVAILDEDDPVNDEMERFHEVRSHVYVGDEGGFLFPMDVSGITENHKTSRFAYGQALEWRDRTVLTPQLLFTVDNTVSLGLRNTLLRGEWTGRLVEFDMGNLMIAFTKDVIAAITPKWTVIRRCDNFLDGLRRLNGGDVERTTHFIDYFDTIENGNRYMVTYHHMKVNAPFDIDKIKRDYPDLYDLLLAKAHVAMTTYQGSIYEYQEVYRHGEDALIGIGKNEFKVEVT